MLARHRLSLAVTTAVALLALAPAAPRARGGPLGARPPAQAGQPGFDEFHQEIFFAVLEGLYRDGFSSEVVAALVETDPESGYPRSFVQGCPICMPALDAMRTYLGRPPFTSKVRVDTFGPGLSETGRADLTSAVGATRRAALQAHVERWIEDRMGRLRLDEGERALWRRAMELRAKKGMGMLEQFRRSGVASYADFETCPLCQGASDATQSD